MSLIERVGQGELGAFDMMLNLGAERRIKYAGQSISDRRLGCGYSHGCDRGGGFLFARRARETGSNLRRCVASALLEGAIMSGAAIFAKGGGRTSPELSMDRALGDDASRTRVSLYGRGSLEASIRFSQLASEDDRQAGARIFREQCARCHGSDGSGGSSAPSLTRSEYTHGDSDLAIYRVLRDGVSGTAMPRARSNATRADCRSSLT